MMKLRSKKAWGKRKEQVLWRGSWFIHHLQNMSHHKMYACWYCVVNEEVPSTSSQIFEQVEVIQEVVLPRISQLNQLSKRNFLQKKTLEKGKWIWYYLLHFPSHQLTCYRVIDLSILQEFFLSVSKFLSCNEEKTLELKKDNEKEWR